MREPKLSIYNKFLVFAVVILPFTLLRFGIMGFGELIFFCASIIELGRQNDVGQIRIFTFTKFWLAFLSISLVGYLYHITILNSVHGTFGGMAFDFSGYFLVLLSCFALENLIAKGRVKPQQIIISIFYWASFVLTSLYIYGLFYPSLFGFPIKYYSYFVPFANNVHQVSMFLVPLPFIGLLAIKTERKFVYKILALFLICFDVIMALNSGSGKAILSIILGTAIYILFTIYTIPQARVLRLFCFSFYLLIVTIVILFKFNSIHQFLLMYFADLDNHGARAYLYSQAIEIGRNSPLVGLGAGPHIWGLHEGKFSDIHQTFLTVFLQTGIIGLLAFLSLLFSILRKQFLNPALVAAFSTIMLYASGGDVLRRLPIWILLVLIFYYPVKIKKRSLRTTISH